MPRRNFLSLVRVALSLLVITAMGSSTVITYASESTQTEITVEEPEQSVYEIGEQVSEDKPSDDGDQGDKGIASDETDRDAVCFFIRKDIDGDIPNEPAGHPRSEYSDAIRVDDTLNYKEVVIGADNEDYQEALLEDRITIKNEVSGNLHALPGVEQIKGVAPDFDPVRHYVVWYVIKRANTSGANSDVKIHVDGIIRNRVHSRYEEEAEEEPVEPTEPTDPTEPVDPVPGDTPEPVVPVPGDDPEPVVEVVSSEYTFNMYTTDLYNENGIKYDGKEHLIGGYIIEIYDKESGALLTELKYGPYGDLLNGRVKAVQGEKEAGTVFEYRGKSFRVNVDGAYMTVVNPGQYTIPFMFGGKPISLEDIRIWDENGKLIDTGISKEPAKDKKPDEVRKISITITAGTTVQNDNGETITNGNVNISGDKLLEGHRLVTTIVGSQTGPGTSVNEITNFDIVDENGNSVKKYYDVKVVNGKLVVVAVAGTGEQAVNSTGSASTSILVKDGNKTVVKNVPIVLGASRDGDSGDEGQVLGARRGETGDFTINAGVRLSLIILCIMLIMIINVKRNKTE